MMANNRPQSTADIKKALQLATTPKNIVNQPTSFALRIKFLPTYCESILKKGLGENGYKELKKGVVVGGGVSLTLLPVDNLQAQYHLNLNDESYSFAKAFKHAFSKRPVRGAMPSFAHGTSKNAIMFPVKSSLEQYIYPSLAAFFAGGIGIYATAPFAFLKYRIFISDKKLARNEFAVNDYFSGAHATALRTGKFFAAFLIVKEGLNQHTDNKFLVGIFAGWIGAIVSNPAATLADYCKAYKIVSLKATWGAMVDIFRQNGLSGFYRGFFGLTIARMGIQGVAMNTLMDLMGDKPNEAIHCIEEPAANKLTR